MLDKSKWERLNEKKNLSDDNALVTVNQNGYALKYVKEQTPEICLAAVTRNGYALRYVEERIFDEIESKEKLITINGKEVSENTIALALKEYFK